MADWKLKIGIERPDVKQAEHALNKIFKQMDKLDRKAKSTDKTIRGIGSRAGGGGGRGGKNRSFQTGKTFGGAVTGLGSSIAGGLGVGSGAAATLAVLSALKSSILAVGTASKRAAVESAEFQNAIVSISRISGIAEEDVSAMSEEFLKLSTSIPVSGREFQKFAEIASRFGIDSTEGVSQFAKSFGLLKSIIGDVSEATVKSVARIASITKFDTSEIDKLLNSVVVLGKNFATSEDQIIRTAERIAGDISEFDASAEQVLGLSTAFDALGIKSELGGSALVRILGAVQDKALTTSKDFDRLVESSGLASNEFRQMSLNSPVEALEALIKSGDSGSKIMDKLGLSGVRVQGVLGRLANNTELFTEAMDISSDQIRSNNVLLSDADRQAATTAGKMERLGNAVSAAFIGVGDAGEDAFGDLLSDVILTVESFAGLNDEAIDANPNIASLGESFRDLFIVGVDALGTILDNAEKMAPIFNSTVEVIGALIGSFGKLSELAARSFDFLDDNLFEQETWDKLFGNIRELKVTMEDVDERLELIGEFELIDDPSEFTGFRQTFGEKALSGFIDIKKTNAEIKKIDEIESKIDAFNKKAADIDFETSLKEGNFDEVEKRIARLRRQFKEDRKALDLNTPDGVEALKQLEDSFALTIEKLTISGLVDDIKEIEDSIDKITEQDEKLQKDFLEINKELPEVAAITDVVAAGKFISDSRQEEEKTRIEKEKIDLARKSLKVLEENLLENKKKARAKIVTIRGGS